MPESEPRLSHLERLSKRIILGQYVLFGCILIGALVLGIQNGKIEDEQKRLKTTQSQIAVNQAQVKVLTNQNCRNIATLAAIQRAFIVRQEIQLNALLGSRVTGVSIAQIRRFRKANRDAENTLLFSFDALARENCKPSKTASLPAVIYLHKEGSAQVAAVRPLAETTQLPALTVPLLLPRASGQPLVVSEVLPAAAIPVSAQPVSAPAPSARGSPPAAAPRIIPSPVRSTPTPAPSLPPAATPPPKAKPPPPKEPPPKEKPKPPKEEPPPKEPPPKEPPGKERPPHEKHPPHEHVPPGQEKKAERPVPPGHECHGNGRKKCP